MNCSETLVTFQSFVKELSMPHKFGPMITSLPELPYVPRGPGVKQDALYQGFPELVACWGLTPVKSWQLPPTASGLAPDAPALLCTRLVMTPVGAGAPER